MKDHGCVRHNLVIHPMSPDECLALVNSTDNEGKKPFVCLEHVYVVSVHQFLCDSRPKQWETLPWRSCISVCVSDDTHLYLTGSLIRYERKAEAETDFQASS